MRKFSISVIFMTFSICLLGVAANAQELLGKGVYFSTEEEFVTRGHMPPDGNPIVSDGDLLNSAGFIYMRNQELLRPFQIKFDLGLDAADVIEEKDRIVVFSTELDHPEGLFTAGDLLSTNGAILPNSALLAAFGLPRDLDLGLDAVQLVGKQETVIRFVDEIKTKGKDFWLQDPKRLAEWLKELGMDIWFSTEGTAPSPQRPRFLDGDLLSAASGTVVLSNQNALPVMVPAGIPDRGVDFGMDAVAVWRDKIEQMEALLFSTEINGKNPNFTDGDALRRGDGVFFRNDDLIRAFEPKVKDLGLDALSLRTRSITAACRFERVGGVVVNAINWDNIGGFVDPALTGRKDHTFGGRVSIRGDLPPEAVEHRVLYRPETGANSPILMPAAMNWRVDHCALGISVPVVIGGDGWMSTAYWKNSLRACNHDLILVDWNSRAGSDGKYILSLQMKDATGRITTCQELPIQVDNTKPKLSLTDTNECKKYSCADMPLTIQGEIQDAHFSNYQLRFRRFGMPATRFAERYYYEGAPAGSEGTIPAPGAVTLGTLDIPGALGKSCRDITNDEEGRYTVLLHAYDRSLLGGFTPSVNGVADPSLNPADRQDRNWDWTLTNFEFYK